ncbi:MAG TPA: hypothetical protein VF680_11730 [Allosphingosinicella sp.]|jgi:hypothetical protein
MAQHRKAVFALVRPWLDADGFTSERIAALDQGLAAAGIAPDAGGQPPAASSTTRLAEPAAFFAHIKRTNTLGPTLEQDEVDGCNAIIEACGHAGWPIADTAYALATAYHETAGTMKPIREYGRGKGRKYGAPTRHGGQIAFGRGYVQLTWDYNYERADRELGLGGRLLADFDLALDPAIAAAIMVRGMREGWFTTRDLDDDLPRQGAATLEQFVRSRDIINGTDKALKIGREAIDFQAGLIAGGWRAAT